MDQAQTLRDYMHRFHDQQEQKPLSRIITITSGKGGVGKSNFSLNFALALKEFGKKVVILDLDLSTANINILMGIRPRYSLADVLYQRKSIWDVIEQGTFGIEYIAGGLEMEDLSKIDQTMVLLFLSQLQELQTYADFILLDTGAGISKELVDFILASDETILVTTPEPTSIADSYAVMKTVLRYTRQNPTFFLVVNRARSYLEAVETSRAMKNASSKFLKMPLKTLGFLMEDEHIYKSVKSQMPFLIAYPKCSASKSIKEIAYSYLPDVNRTSSVSTKGLHGFFEKILSLGKSS
jgi:flagellar biosynthesis protein FlhG